MGCGGVGGLAFGGWLACGARVRLMGGVLRVVMRFELGLSVQKGGVYMLLSGYGRCSLLGLG